MVRVKFLGAAQTVTGSKYHVSCDGLHLMVDCGMFQGAMPKKMRALNNVLFGR